jgi:hypothetical protein
MDVSESEQSYDPSFEEVTPKKKVGGRKNISKTKSSKRNRKEKTAIRKDVVLKTILRKMRKFYTKEFNKTTKYISKKRCQKPNLY